MKANEVRSLSDEEARRQLSEKIDELFRLRVRSATERMENISAFRNLKRDIARIKTVLRERELAGSGESA